jgi:fatty-acyl-CoA synthase
LNPLEVGQIRAAEWVRFGSPFSRYHRRRMTIWKALERACAMHPDRPGLVSAEVQLTWGEVLPRIQRVADGLARAGVGAGDRVALLEWNSIEFFELTFAVAGLGAVLMPMNFRLDGRGVAQVLRDGGPRVLVAHGDFAGLVGEALEHETALNRVIWTSADPPQIDGVVSTPWPKLDGPRTSADTSATHDHREWSSELCHLYYTSGTTGQPKGVMLTHANVGAHAQAAVAELALDENDVWGHFAPMFHLADAWATIAVTLAGGCHVFVPHFDAARAAQAIDAHGVTVTNLIPTMLGQLTRHAEGSSSFDGSKLRMLLSGGASISPELVRRVSEVFGCEYVQTYGMTETSPYLTMSLLDAEIRALSVDEQMRYRARTGRAFRGVELRLVDANGADVSRDGESVGEILARGASVTAGYWNNPEETAAALRDGWLHTGDLATVDGRGFFDIVDRKKDMIITGGENVYSTEVEHVLHEHPAVLEVAVVGRPDAQWGERVHAVVALTRDEAASAEELIGHCRARLPGFKTPKSVEFMPTLPKTGSGKIHKRALRER